jgi:uncharacterized protein
VAEDTIITDAPMSHISWPVALSITLTFFLAGLVKGVTGMGLPTVAMGVLGAVMTPVEAASILIVPSFVTNLWQLLTGPSLAILAKRLWPMMAGITAGTIVASSLLTADMSGWTTMGLAAALALYAGVSLLARPLSVPAGAEAWLSPLIGLATGAVTGGTGVLVIPAVPYLQALGFNKDDLVQALGLSFTVSTFALAIGLIWHGAFRLDNLALSALAILPSLIGMWAGQAVRAKVSPATFRRWFLICLVLLAAELMLRPLL